MAKDGRVGREHALIPANDHHDDIAPQAMTLEQVRTALRPPVHLLARQAAQEWLAESANDNTPPRCQSSDRALPDVKPCPDDQE